MEIPDNFMRCTRCNGTLTEEAGYYGCTNAKQKTCGNKSLIPKTKMEEIVLSDLMVKFMKLGDLECLFEDIKETIEEILETTPCSEEIVRKSTQALKFLRIENP